jgi:1-acyl-sn-glycerol-3-phosphate acyltransferase
MKKILGKFVLFISRWKSDYETDFDIKKCVMIAAPHTSNWDLLYAIAVFWKYDINVKFFIKNSYTKGLHGFIFRGIGAVGVDRSKNNKLVDYATELFEKNEELVLLVPAEGTRKRVKRWKKGFYHIAEKANVPVALGFLDYKNKIAGVGKIVHLSGNFEADMNILEEFYKDKTGRNPELFNPEFYLRKKS